MWKKILAWSLFIVPLVLALARGLLDFAGGYQDIIWLSENVGPIMDFIIGQPAVWFYGTLSFLAVVGLSLHLPRSVWEQWYKKAFPHVRRGYPLEILEYPAVTIPGDPQVTEWTFGLENRSQETVNHLSVVLDSFKGEEQSDFSRINLKFSTDRGVTFSLRPGERAWVKLAQNKTSYSSAYESIFQLGPMEDGSYLRGIPYWEGAEDLYVRNSTLKVRIIADNLPEKNLTFFSWDEGGITRGEPVRQTL